MKFPLTLLILPIGLALVGCSKQPEAEAPAVRPVLTTQVHSERATTPQFVGVVSPRTALHQAFRIGGTLVTRQASTGNAVRAGEILATLDATTSELALQTARANFASAEAQYANASAAEARLRSLNQSDVVSLANLEQAEQQSSGANASLIQAEARVRQAEEQLSYATLIAPIDGIVMSVGAEPGSVVGAGQIVVTVADPSTRDLVIDIPEAIINEIAIGTVFEIAPQLSPESVVDGKVREIDPQANPLTRTWRVKIAIEDNISQFWLGTTATARLQTSEDDRLVVPASAIRRDGETASVFVVDEAAAVVRQRSITLDITADTPIVTEGLELGETIVTAGVNGLADGQAIKLDAESSK
jgi:RND family efflux transporter MFP subunit